MAISSFAELKTAVANWTERDDLTDRIPEFITLAEARFNRILIVPERETADTLVAASTVALPADFYGIKAIWLDTDPKATLEQLPLQELRMAWSSSATGLPRNFSIQEGDTLVLGPSPDSAYNIDLIYWTKIPALGDSQASNWLLASHPDIYLFGALVEAEQFMVNQDVLIGWKARLDGAISELLSAGQRKNHSASPQRIRAPYCV